MKPFAMAAAALFLLGASASAQSVAPKPAPDLDSCVPDVQRFCSKVVPGGGGQIACLHAHVKQLSPACHTLLPLLKVPGQKLQPQK